MLTAQKKKNVVKKLGKSEKDTGTPEVQVGLLTKQIEELSKHLKVNKKDNHSRRGLMKMISKRRAHMKYLQAKSPRRYNALAKELGL